MATRYSRRTFLFQSTAAAGLGAVGLSAIARTSFAQSPAERIRVGLIGAGWRGGQLLDQLRKEKDVEVVAICDPDAKLVEQAQKRQPTAKGYADLRKLLEDQSIDAVVIATCNHWHCLAAVWACEAGKDVYVEKPLSFRLWEGQQLINTARKQQRVVQVGTQQRSDPMQDEIRAFLHDEKGIGEFRSVVITRFGVRESIGKRTTPLEPPKSLDYNLWVGPAADVPIYRNKLDYDWHWDWNTGNGECANWGVHIIDDVRNLVFNDKVTLPSEVASGGGRVVWDDAGATPNLQFATLKAGELPVTFALSNLPSAPKARGPLKFEGVESGYIVFGEGGAFHGGRGMGTVYDPAGKVVRRFHGDSGAGHFKNFFQAVRERNPRLLNADVAVGHDSTNWSHVINAAWLAANEPGMLPEEVAKQSSPAGEIEELMRTHLHAYFPDGAGDGVRMSPSFKIDAAREEFVGAGAVANQYLGPRSEYRGEFVFPSVS
jgi:predicted dehydrogenase